MKFSPVLIIKYEDLIDDTEKTFIKILNFLNTLMKLKIDFKKVSNVVNSCNFEILSQKEKELIQSFYKFATNMNTKISEISKSQ